MKSNNSFKNEATCRLFAYKLYIYIYIYIVIHRQTISFYQNSSVWLDTLDARSISTQFKCKYSLSKPGSKPIQLSLRPLNQQAYHVG